MNNVDLERIKKIIQTYKKLTCYLEEHHILQDDILNDYSVQWTITTPLYNIGEQTYKITTELKDKFPDIPWKKIAGLRHRLVHDDEGINWDIIPTIIYQSLPRYIEQLEEIERLIL